MKIFLVSSAGDSLGLAEKITSEGHQVSMYIRDGHKGPNENITITKHPSADMVNADLIIVEDRRSGKFVDKAREMGRRVIGGGSGADRLNSDVKFNRGVLEGCGLKLAESGTKGLMIEIGGWFNGIEYLRPAFIGFPKYRLGAGDIGPITKGSGLVGFYKMRSRLYHEVLRTTETFIKTINYKGFVDIKGYVNNGKFQAIAMEAGLMYPTIHVVSELHTSITKFLVKIADGIAKVAAVQPGKIGVGVGWFETIHIPRPEMLCACGGTIEEAKIKVYKKINNANLDPIGIYRIDIGDDFTQNLRTLSSQEWL